MTIKSQWKCGECGFLHDWEENAVECCAPMVTEVFLCPICKEEHGDEDDALDCCDKEIAEELTVDDGMKFPQGITDPAIYIKEFCEANKLTS